MSSIKTSKIIEDDSKDSTNTEKIRSIQSIHLAQNQTLSAISNPIKFSRNMTKINRKGLLSEIAFKI